MIYALAVKAEAELLSSDRQAIPLHFGKSRFTSAMYRLLYVNVNRFVVPRKGSDVWKPCFPVGFGSSRLIVVEPLSSRLHGLPATPETTRRKLFSAFEIVTSPVRQQQSAWSQLSSMLNLPNQLGFSIARHALRSNRSFIVKCMSICLSDKKSFRRWTGFE